jgi:hypothetical protein
MRSTERPADLRPIKATWPRLLFSILLLALSLTAYFVPYYDWDLVAYVGSAIALHENDAKSIQTQAFEAMRNELPEEDYLDIASGSYFRRDVASNPDHFRQQLRFYQIRPLYIHLLGWLHRVGPQYVNATRLLSATSLMLTGILLFLWSRRYVDERFAAICIPLLLIAPVLFTSARTGSPDALSALFVLLGSFELVEYRRSIIGSAILLVSLFLRTDNVIFVVCILAGFALTQRRTRDRIGAAVCAILAVTVVLGINRIEHSYSWPVLMQNTSIPIVNPAEINPKITAADYFSAVRDMVDEARESSVTAFPFLAALALLSSRTTRVLKSLVTIVLLSWAAHLVLFPHIEDRYFISGSVLIGIASLSTLRGSAAEA